MEPAKSPAEIRLDGDVHMMNSAAAAARFDGGIVPWPSEARSPGLPELFRAMAEVDAELWVVGERLVSDHASTVDDAIAEVERNATLKRRIRFLGYRRDVPALLRAADIFTLPSHREGMPRSIIEAMMTGLPVVATDIRGSREEIVPEGTGTLVPVNDAAALAAALNRLVVDAALRAHWGAVGRARALALYDEAKVVARQLDLLGLAAPVR